MICSTDRHQAMRMYDDWLIKRPFPWFAEENCFDYSTVYTWELKKALSD